MLVLVEEKKEAVSVSGGGHWLSLWCGGKIIVGQ